MVASFAVMYFYITYYYGFHNRVSVNSRIEVLVLPYFLFSFFFFLFLSFFVLVGAVMLKYLLNKFA